MARKPIAKTGPKQAQAGAVEETPPSSGLKDVERFVQLMVAHDLTELSIEDGSRKIYLKRAGQAPPAGPLVEVGRIEPISPPPSAKHTAQTLPPPEPQAMAEIRSPMVGTFYAGASPDSEPYASQGEVVAPDDVVAVVEAMKVMNEIKAECSGTIVEVCAKNAQPVEYGQVLFRVKPS